MFRYNPQEGQIKRGKLNRVFPRVKGSETGLCIPQEFTWIMLWMSVRQRLAGNEMNLLRNLLKLDKFIRKCWLKIIENFGLTDLGSNVNWLSH